MSARSRAPDHKRQFKNARSRAHVHEPHQPLLMEAFARSELIAENFSFTRQADERWKMQIFGKGEEELKCKLVSFNVCDY